MSPDEVYADVWRTGDVVLTRWIVAVHTPRITVGPTGASCSEGNARRKAARMVARERSRVAREAAKAMPSTTRFTVR